MMQNRTWYSSTRLWAGPSSMPRADGQKLARPQGPTGALPQIVDRRPEAARRPGALAWGTSSIGSIINRGQRMDRLTPVADIQGDPAPQEWTSRS
jgi:hypothetical protein